MSELHVDQVTECHVQSSFNTSRHGGSTTSLDSPFQYLITPSVKKFFLMSSLGLPWCTLGLFSHPIP